MWGLPKPYESTTAAAAVFGHHHDEFVQPRNLVSTLFAAVTQPPQPPSVTCNGARVRLGSTTQHE